MMDHMSLSVVINTKNSERTLKLALDSVQFASEIIVMDMHSTDDTIKIAEKAKAKIFTHPDVGYVEPARNAAIAKASNDWVFILDADEVVPEKLAHTLQEIANSSETADAYWVPRHNKVFGEYLNHTGWWPDYQLRLFKKGAVKWSDEIHQPPMVTGKQEHLPVDTELAIQHDNYPTVEEFVSRMNNYTTVESKQAKHTALANASAADVIKLFSDEFLSRFFAHKGYKDGKRGTMLSLLQAMYPIMTAAKVWQDNGYTSESEKEGDTSLVIDELEKFSQSLQFWINDYKGSKLAGWKRLMWKLHNKIR
jgi:glycosyltransferase involved in cell wall biosynthesis